ncbi:MAG: hypothetical protein H0T61_01060 [Actinobacteria bacterium]|nr:hypothetical protein [Actinomycetota bacterium]
MEKLRGDRAGDLQALADREWDAVVDTSGYLPNLVRNSAAALAGSAHYCFVSTISVYADFSGPVDEGQPACHARRAPERDVTSESYGPLKALCEAAVCEVFEE